ncbi:MAG: phytanoyl-CoA dioxygenase family protein [Planctomycetes bacterium]|nr:phytanoyl-CoA dioxygenase family protein [Planctomycetota bacterium]
MEPTREQIRSFNDDGYLVVEDLIDPAAVAALRARLDELQEASVAGADAPVKFQLEKGGAATAVKPSLRKLDEPALTDPLFRSVAATPAILDIVTTLTGGGVHLMLYSDQVFMKPAFCGSEKPLHQDNSYFKVTPHTAGITCWIALDDATTENGCLHYIPGSHKLGLVKHREMAEKMHLTPDVDFPLPTEVAVPVRAGTCIFHHLLAMHSSKANRSALPRRAYAVHYANRSAESCVRSWDDMLPLR